MIIFMTDGWFGLFKINNSKIIQFLRNRDRTLFALAPFLRPPETVDLFMFNFNIKLDDLLKSLGGINKMSKIGGVKHINS